MIFMIYTIGSNSYQVKLVTQPEAINKAMKWPDADLPQTSLKKPSSWASFDCKTGPSGPKYAWSMTYALNICVQEEEWADTCIPLTSLLTIHVAYGMKA